MAYQPVTRLFVEASLGEGGSLGLAAPQAHYLKSVLRLDKGDELALFNGRDGEYGARIAGQGRGWCSLDILAPRKKQRDEAHQVVALYPLSVQVTDVAFADSVIVSAVLPATSRGVA